LNCLMTAYDTHTHTHKLNVCVCISWSVYCKCRVNSQCYGLLHKKHREIVLLISFKAYTYVHTYLHK